MAGQGKIEMDMLLAASLKELAAKRPIEKITIKEITDKAGVIRPTFYNHFQDKYELLEWIIKKEILEPIRPLVRSAQVSEAVKMMFTAIEKDRVFYSRAVRMEGIISFDSVVHKCLKELFLTIIQEQKTGGRTKYAWLTPEVVASYYAQSLGYMIITWIRQGMEIPPQEIADTYQYMMTHSMQEILSEL